MYLVLAIRMGASIVNLLGLCPISGSNKSAVHLSRKTCSTSVIADKTHRVNLSSSLDTRLV